METKPHIIVPKNGNPDGSFAKVLVEPVHEEAGRLIVRFLTSDSCWKKGDLYFLDASKWKLQEPSQKLVGLITEANEKAA